MQEESNKTPFLTVVTINKNNAKGLRGTIESVLTQDGIAEGDLEYIIIDGASSDESVKVIEEEEKKTCYKHKISYWQSEEDTGIYSAMNKGIKKAHGEYIAMLNSGDYYVKDALRGIKERKTGGGGILYGAVDAYKEDVFIETWGCSAKCLEELRCSVAHPASFVPKDVYEKVGLYDESYKILGDFDLFVRFYKAGIPFIYLSKIIANFDLSGVSNQGLPLRDKEYKRIKRLYLEKSGRKKERLHKIKRVIKLFIPYGVTVILRRISKRLNNKSKGRERRR